MESLFEVLYQYAVENCCGPLSPEEREEQEQLYDEAFHQMDSGFLAQVEEKYAAVDREIKRLEHTGAPPSPALDRLLEGRGEPPCPHGARLIDLLRRPRLDYAALAPFDPERPALPPEIREQVEISVKYQGYIDRQNRQVEELRRLEDRPLPPDVDYLGIQGLRLEARQKLDKIRPLNLGQASRVSGVSPADVAALMIYLERGQSCGNRDL